MRITNTMLKQASLSSGLPLIHSTLLDHLNNDSNDLMTNALKSRNQMMKTTGYGKLKKAAEDLMNSTEKLSEDSWYDSLAKTAEEKIAKADKGSEEGKKTTEVDSDYTKKTHNGDADTSVSETEKKEPEDSKTDTANKIGAKSENKVSDDDKVAMTDAAASKTDTATAKTVPDSATRKEVSSVLEKIAKTYNDTSNALLKDANNMNQFYRQELAKALNGASKDLGLALSKSGTLTFDADKMKKDLTVDELQEKLQPIAKKLAFISEHVADNASANLNSVSTRYGASGKNYYNADNRYDFRG